MVAFYADSQSRPYLGSSFKYCLTEENPEKIAFIDSLTRHTLTRGQVRRDALRVAWGLRNLSHFGDRDSMKAGDIILAFSPTSMTYPILTLATMAAGTPIACSSAAQTPKELAFQIGLTKPTHYAVHPTLIQAFVQAMKLRKLDMADVGRRLIILGSRAELPGGVDLPWTTISDLTLQSHELVPECFDGERSHETAIIFYSSGTTSLPKAIEITHANVCANLAILPMWGGMTGDSIVVGPFPPYHVAGQMLLNLAPLLLGAASILVTHFELKSFFTLIQEYKVTLVLLTPPLVAAFANHPLIPNYDFTSLRNISVGGAPTSESIMTACYKRMRLYSAPDFCIHQAYGLSELAGCTHFTTIGRVDKLGASGRFVPGSGMNGRLVDDDGKDVEHGDVGELWLSGPTVMKGYLNSPEENAKAITKDGWFKTGDLATIDDEGFLYIIDRKKELIKYNAFQVAPAELESLLLDHPEIADAGVIGVASANGATELPRAYVVPRDPALLADVTFPVAIQRWVEGKVAYYKYLRGGVVLMDNLPRSPAGKLLRRELKELAKAERSGSHMIAKL